MEPVPTADANYGSLVPIDATSVFLSSQAWVAELTCVSPSAHRTKSCSLSYCIEPLSAATRVRCQEERALNHVTGHVRVSDKQ